MRRLALAALLLLAASSLRAAPAVKLRVEIIGLGGIVRSYLPSGDVKRNVLSVLSIEAARKEKRLTEARIRQMHEAAPEEIRTALQPFGYYRPQIVPSLTSEGEGRFVARYEIEPGPELRYTSVDVALTGAGSEVPLFQGLTATFPLKPGDVVDHAVYEAAKKTLEDVAGENGYIQAAFTVHTLEIDVEAYTAKATLRFTPGALYRFGEVRFHQDFLEPRVIRGYVTWGEGAPLKLSKLLEMQDALSDSPYFSRVEIEMKPEEVAAGDRVPIDVTLLASKRTKYSFGVGYGTDTGPRGSAGIQFRRLSRSGHRAETEGKVSDIEKSVSARYSIPGAYPRTDVLSFTIAYADVDTATAKSRTFLTGPSLTRLHGRWNETFSLVFQRETYTVGVDSGISNLLIPGASWSRVVADDRLEATRGFRLQADLRAAVNDVLSNATFFQAKVEGKLVRSLSKRVRAIGRAELGVLATPDFRILPPRIRFFAGGDQSVRGYSYNGLGTRDEKGNVIGGRFLRVLTAELDYKFLDRWGGFRVAAFGDVGNATLEFGGAWKYSAGVGLRWRSPIGMLRGDVAFALSEPGAPLKLHLNIGPDL